MRTNEKRAQLVVIAGGLGTRLENVGISTPKALLNVSGSSLIDRIIAEANSEAFSEILWCLGHKSDPIEQAIRENQVGNVSNIFVNDRERLGTLGALIQARDQLADEFCVIYGDLFISETNLHGLLKVFLEDNCAAMILVKFTSHPEDSDLVVADEDWTAVEFLKYPHAVIPELPIGNAGVFFFKKESIPIAIPVEPLDIFKDLLPELLKNKAKVRLLFHQGTIRDVGQVERLRAETLSQLPPMGLSNKKAIFFDRDGTLNLANGHIGKYEDLHLTPFAESLLVSARGNFDFLGLITNQPIVARGEASNQDVEEINSYILTLAGLPKSTFNVIKYCPHYPEGGFEGEIPSLKIHCKCRKPSPGMILEAVDELKVRATECLFVGDSTTDLQAAEAVGMRWIHLFEETESPCRNIHTQGRGFCLSGHELILRIEAGLIS